MDRRNEDTALVALRGGLRGRFRRSFDSMENAFEVLQDRLRHAVNPAERAELMPLLEELQTQLICLRRLGDQASDAATAALLQGTCVPQPIALLAQPLVTLAQNKIDGLRMALDLTAEWDKLDNGSALITGVIVARRDVVEANPGAVDSFLQDYAASVEWVNANNADAAQLIAEYGIIEAAPVAEKALPYCNIVCITGSEMKDKLSGYLQVLADAEPSSVGGTLPGDNLYYGG